MAGLSLGSRWTRAGIGARAALAALLAVGAAALVVDLADWRYVRLDLTASHRNSLDPEVLDVLDKLPEPVVVDVFMRPLAQPYLGLFTQAQERVLELLAIVHNARRESIEVNVHEPGDFEATQERMRELGIEGTNKVVVSCGARHDELQLFGELWTVDWGNPSEPLARYLTGQGIPGVVDPRGWQPNLGFRPAQLLEFHGEELLFQALLKVSAGKAPRIYFAKGQGEPALEGSDATDFSRLRTALLGDGFEVAEWDPLERPVVPDDCDVLALVGARQPYQAATREAVVRWVEAGGHLLAAPHLDELHQHTEGGIVDLLAGFGILTRPGIVCQPLVQATGEKYDGSEQCAWLVIDERGLQPGHELTEPLRMRGRRVQFTLSPSFEGGPPSDSGLLLPLVTSSPDSWRDLEKYDFRFNPAKGEQRGRFTLVTVKQLPSTKDADGSVHQGRVLAIASAFFFDNDSIDVNRDFVLNAFNWLGEREYRIAARPLDAAQSFLDFERSNARPVLTWVAWLGLPGLCALVAVVIGLRRRSDA